MDLKPIFDFAFSVVDPLIITVLVPWLGVMVLRKLHVDTNSALAQRVLTAASNGAALALSRAQALADEHALLPATKADAIEIGVAYVEKAISSGTLAKLGVTPDHLSDMVEAQIHKQSASPQVTMLPIPNPPETAPTLRPTVI